MALQLSLIHTNLLESNVRSFWYHNGWVHNFICCLGYTKFQRTYIFNCSENIEVLHNPQYNFKMLLLLYTHQSTPHPNFSFVLFSNFLSTLNTPLTPQGFVTNICFQSVRICRAADVCERCCAFFLSVSCWTLTRLHGYEEGARRVTESLIYQLKAT